MASPCCDDTPPRAPSAHQHQSLMSTHPWTFAARFRRNAFGWRSDAPIQRLKEALAEIKQVARKEPAVAAEGAVLLLEKLSPALQQVDSSSGALGSAVNRAIDVLVPLIVKAEVAAKTRQGWLKRLWATIEDEGVPYLEYMADHWGDLCANPALASAWADEFLPTVESVWGPQAGGHGYFKGTTACLACLLASGRHETLLALLERSPHPWWHDRRWGVKALVALGRPDDAIRYAEASRGINDPPEQIAAACEAILLEQGRHDEAYSGYALRASQGATHLATFRAIARKYPGKPPAEILGDLAASTPGAEGKWFAAAKDAGLLDLALRLVARSPADPRTLTRAAEDFADPQPRFALGCATAALRWIAQGQGYDITVGEVQAAYAAGLRAAAGAGVEPPQLIEEVRKLLAPPATAGAFVESALGYRLLI